MQLSGFSSLRSNYNYTIGTASSINGCCRCIFQNTKTFDISRIKIVDISFDSVYQHQCTRTGAKRTHTTNPELREVVTRFATSGHGNNARHASTQHVTHRYRRSLNPYRVYIGDSAYYRNLSLSITPHYHNLIKLIDRLLQSNLLFQFRSSIFNFPSFITYIRKYECTSGRNTCYLKPSVKIGNNSYTLFSFYLNRHSDEFLSLLVQDDTRNIYSALGEHSC